MDEHFDFASKGLARIKVVGVGGGGNNAVQNMIESVLHGVTFICANTDAQALARSGADVKLQIGEKLTRGLGAGANPQVGREAALESIGTIKESIGEAEMIFVTAGMGGGTGTGAAPVVAQAAKELGALTVGVVTRPFSFEGERRRIAAEEGITALREHVDSLIIIPNDRLLTLGPKNAKLRDMLKRADDVLYSAVRGISDIITIPGLINVDFADVRTVMRDAGGLAMMGAGVASGEGRALEAARRAITSPLLEDVSIAGAKAVLINITASEDIGLDEFRDANDFISEAARSINGNAQIVCGTAFDESAGDEIRVTVIATGLENGAESMSSLSAARPKGQTATVTSFAKSLRAAPAPQATVKAEAPESQPRQRAWITNEVSPDKRHAAAFERRDEEIKIYHKPGQESFMFDNDDLELPTFIRKQAN